MSTAFKTFLFGLALAGIASLFGSRLWSGLQRGPSMPNDSGNPTPL